MAAPGRARAGAPRCRSRRGGGVASASLLVYLTLGSVAGVGACAVRWVLADQSPAGRGALAIAVAGLLIPGLAVFAVARLSWGDFRPASVSRRAPGALGHHFLDVCRGSPDLRPGDQFRGSEFPTGCALRAHGHGAALDERAERSAAGAAYGRSRSADRPGTASQAPSPGEPHADVDPAVAGAVAATVSAWFARSGASAPGELDDEARRMDVTVVRRIRLGARPRAGSDEPTTGVYAVEACGPSMTPSTRRSPSSPGWSGAGGGRGDYPTMETPTSFGQENTVTRRRPFLRWQSRTWLLDGGAISSDPRPRSPVSGASPRTATRPSSCSSTRPGFSKLLRPDRAGPDHPPHRQRRAQPAAKNTARPRVSMAWSTSQLMWAMDMAAMGPAAPVTRVGATQRLD